MIRRGLICGLMVLLAVSVAWGAPGIVKTRDGQTIEGDVTERGENVEVKIRGIVSVIPRERIESITYPPDLDQQYRERLDKLDARDLQGHMDLARWAFENRRYELARDAADRAQRIDPNSVEAATLMETIRVQMRLEQTRPGNGAAPVEPAATDEGEAAQPPANQRILERRLLTPEQINIIRQEELTREDRDIRVRFDKDVKRRFTAASNQEYNRFNSLPTVEQALAILDGDPELRQDVHIVNDPRAIMEFKVVQRTLLAGCAASGCHGGVQGGGLILFSPASTEAATYTNFYILQQYVRTVQAPADMFGGGEVERRLINRTNPDQSLLLQYSLPTDVSEFDHPEVQGYRGLFKDRRDRRYEQILNWIRNTLRPTTPNYGIDYQPPTGASTQPTAEPPAPEPAQ